MSTLKDKLKKLSFFTHYPKEHESITYNNVIEEYPGKEEKWNEWFSSYYINGKWYLNEPITILKFTGTDFIGENNRANFSNSIVDWGDGTIESPSQLTHTYADNKEHTIKIINAPYSSDWCFESKPITSITIPSNITTLGGNGCFYKCSNLTSITIPSNITSFGMNCFNRCSFKNITIPPSVVSIGDGCFYRCSNLINITIPDSVTNIKNECFSYCTSLIDINLEWTTSDKILPYNNTWIINANSNLKFTIPQGTTSLYEAKGYPSEKLEEETS